MSVLSTEYARESRHFVLHKLHCNTTIACRTIALGDRIVQCVQQVTQPINPLNPELNPICYLLALLGVHHFLHVSRIRVKLLTFRLLMSYIYIYIYI